MKFSARAIVCFRNFACLAHAFAGVVQCVFAILLKGSQVGGFEFGLNVMLGVMNIPLGCVMTTVLRKRSESGEPQQYVALNRLSVSLLWHSVVFNAACASVVYLLPSAAPSPATTSTRFHERWLVALDYMAVASLAVPLVLVFLATTCLLSLSRSPLKNVIPREDGLLDDYMQFARVDSVELQPYTWVFDGRTPSQLTQRGGAGRARKPLSSRGSDLPFPPPRFTFSRGRSVGGSGDRDHLAVAGPSMRGDGRTSLSGGGTGCLPVQMKGSAREGYCRSLSSGDDDFENLDSFITDCFDEVPLGSSEAAPALSDDGNPASACGVASRSPRGREGAKPALQRLASLDLGVDSLGNLTNLELLARQWRTSAMLRKIWRRSERRVRSSRE